MERETPLLACRSAVARRVHPVRAARDEQTDHRSGLPPPEPDFSAAERQELLAAGARVASPGGSVKATQSREVTSASTTRKRRAPRQGRLGRPWTYNTKWA